MTQTWQDSLVEMKFRQDKNRPDLIMDAFPPPTLHFEASYYELEPNYLILAATPNLRLLRVAVFSRELATL